MIPGGYQWWLNLARPRAEIESLKDALRLASRDTNRPRRAKWKSSSDLGEEKSDKSKSHKSSLFSLPSNICSQTYSNSWEAKVYSTTTFNDTQTNFCFELTSLKPNRGWVKFIMKPEDRCHSQTCSKLPMQTKYIFNIKLSLQNLHIFFK